MYTPPRSNRSLFTSVDLTFVYVIDPKGTEKDTNDNFSQSKWYSMSMRISRWTWWLSTSSYRHRPLITNVRLLYLQSAGKRTNSILLFNPCRQKCFFLWKLVGKVQDGVIYEHCNTTGALCLGKDNKSKYQWRRWLVIAMLYKRIVFYEASTRYCKQIFTAGKSNCSNNCVPPIKEPLLLTVHKIWWQESSPREARSQCTMGQIVW